MMPDSSIAKLRIWGFLEGISFILLLGVCTPLKYYWDIPEPTQYVGAAHGGLFLFYCIWLLVVTMELKWGMKNTVYAFVASLIPFGTFVADKKIFKLYVEEKKVWKPERDESEDEQSTTNG